MEDEEEGVHYDVKITEPDDPGDGTEARLLRPARPDSTAMFRPKQPPAQPLPYVDFARTAAPQPLDSVVVLHRLPKIESRVAPPWPHHTQVGPAAALLRRVGAQYLIGAPVFALTGRTAGLLRCDGFRRRRVVPASRKPLTRPKCPSSCGSDIVETAAEAKSVEEA